MRKRTVAVPLAVVAAGAGLAAGAYAASQPDSHPHKALRCGSEQPLINDAARRLHVTPNRLTDALKQAQVDQIDAAVAAGRLPRAQAKAMKRQIESSPGLPFGLGPLGPEVKAAAVIAPPGLPLKAIRVPGLLGPPAILTAAARYLGLTDGQLIQRLRRGESLAQIAKARGKSNSGLERAIAAAVKSRPRLAQGRVRMSGPPGLPLAQGRVHIQIPAAGPPPCFAGALGFMPPPLVRTWVAPTKR